MGLSPRVPDKHPADPAVTRLRRLRLDLLSSPALVTFTPGDPGWWSVQKWAWRPDHPDRI